MKNRRGVLVTLVLALAVAGSLLALSGSNVSAYESSRYSADLFGNGLHTGCTANVWCPATYCEQDPIHDHLWFCADSDPCYDCKCNYDQGESGSVCIIRFWC